jgi:hypothetical protein
MAHPVFAQRSGQQQHGHPLPVASTLTPSAAKRSPLPLTSWWSAHPLVAALRQHWPEYLMEGAELGLFLKDIGCHDHP